MKTQNQKFKEGEIVTQEKNGWKRKIYLPYFFESDGNMKVGYHYLDEELDKNYQPTGEFKMEKMGKCSQDHLIQWLKR